MQENRQTQGIKHAQTTIDRMCYRKRAQVQRMYSQFAAFHPFAQLMCSSEMIEFVLYSRTEWIRSDGRC